MIQSDAVSRNMQAEKLTLPVLGKREICIEICIAYLKYIRCSYNKKWHSDPWFIAGKFGSTMSIVKTDIGGSIMVREIHSTSQVSYASN